MTMDIKTQVEILCDHSSNSITKHPNQIRREILAAMTAWERQQTHVLREENERLREGLKTLISAAQISGVNLSEGDPAFYDLNDSINVAKYLLTT